jgi:hypothetical protein
MLVHLFAQREGSTGAVPRVRIHPAPPISPQFSAFSGETREIPACAELRGYRRLPESRVLEGSSGVLTNFSPCRTTRRPSRSAEEARLVATVFARAPGIEECYGDQLLFLLRGATVRRIPVRRRLELRLDMGGAPSLRNAPLIKVRRPAVARPRKFTASRACYPTPCADEKQVCPVMRRRPQSGDTSVLDLDAGEIGGYYSRPL